jgi:hypothetical protein
MELTEAISDRFLARSCGIYGERSGIGSGFLPVLRFSLPLLITSVLKSVVKRQT